MSRRCACTAGVRASHARSATACCCNCSSLFADSTISSGAPLAGSAANGAPCGSRYSSITTCAFVPLNPNELTAARRGPALLHTRRCVFT